MSATAIQAPTLYEDWLVRRDRLAGLPMREGDRHRSELRLLEFLLEHYRNSPSAARPARFSARTELYVDRRAIVVHNHLGRGYLSDMHTRQQAEQRVRGVLSRMAAGKSTQVADRPVFHPSAPPTYDETLEKIRGRLCEGNADERLLAIVELGLAGTLDDIGLISDLLALPQQAGEDPFERHVLLTAMKKVVRRLTGLTEPEIPSTTMVYDLREKYEPPPTEITVDLSKVYEPPPTKLTAGLPRIYEPLLLTFYTEPRREDNWISIGNDWGTEFRIDTAGSVYSFDLFGDKPARFVNSSVRQLAFFIKAHQEFVHPLREKGEQQSEVTMFRHRLESIDSKALSSTENWWPVVVERMLPKSNEPEV